MSVHSGVRRVLSALVIGVMAVLGMAVAETAAATPTAAAQEHNGPVIGPARGDSLHVMSFNLRYASTSTPNSWAQRRPVMAELLRREQPTVLGTQEGLYGQLKDIQRDLPDRYDWIGVGRAGGSRDEFMAIFYDTRRLEPLEFDHFWLSDTPDVIGSKSWGNNVIRMVTWVRFADLRTGKEFIAVNTHFDHQSENSRQLSANLVRDRVNGFAPGLPVVLTGDFNTPRGNLGLLRHPGERRHADRHMAGRRRAAYPALRHLPRLQPVGAGRNPDRLDPDPWRDRRGGGHQHFERAASSRPTTCRCRR